MAVVATAERGLIVYQLENQPSEFRRIDSPLKHQVMEGFSTLIPVACAAHSHLISLCCADD